MPKRNKKMFKNPPVASMESSQSRNLRDGAVFRNFFAVGDDVDPRVSLRYMQEMFMGKIEQDVVTMIFTECAYDVEQTLESLMALSNDSNSSSNNSNLETAATSGSSIPLESCELVNEQLSSSVLYGGTESPAGDFLTEAYPDMAAERSLPFHFQNHTQQAEISLRENFTLLENGESEEYLNNDLDKLCNNSSNPIMELDYSPKANFSTTDLENTLPNHFPFYPPSARRNVLLSNLAPMSGLHQSVMGNTPSYVTPFIQARAKSSRGNSLPSNGMFSPRNQNKGIFGIENKNKQQELNVNTISSKIIDGESILVILRGLPGSGKSSLAKELKFSGLVLSTDDYFSRFGRYEFDGRKLSEAHASNQKRAAGALERGVKPVIIDNTNTEAWEMLPYVKLGLKYKYQIYLLEPSTPWKFKPNKLAKRNTHNVSKEKIERMLERYDHSVTADSLIAHIKSLESRKHSDDKEDSGKKSDSNGPNNSNGSSGSSETTIDDSCKNNCVALQAVVHREDELDNIANALNKLEVKVSNENANETNDDVMKFQSLTKIDDINELKQLIQEDSEGSTTLSQNQQMSDSSQDVSGWEAITEPDDDFFWSGKSVTDLCGGARDNCLNNDNEEKKLNIDMNHIGSCPIEINKKNCSIEGINCNSQNDSSLSTTSLIANENVVSAHEHTKENSVGENLYQHDDKNFTIVSHGNKNSVHCDSFWGSNSSSIDWTPACSDSSEFCSNDLSVTGKQKPLEADDEQSESNQCNDSLGNEEGNFNKLNFPNLGCVNWALPSYPIDDSKDCNISKKTIGIDGKDSETQTEPSDFVLLHKLEENKLFVTSVKTLTPSDKWNITSNYAYIMETKSDETLSTPSVVFFDRSTSSDDIPCDDNNHEQFVMLHSCFPEIHDSDLQHLLEICRGDSSWLITILLDWGYKYNVPGNIERVCMKSESDTTDFNVITKDKTFILQEPHSCLPDDFSVTTENLICKAPADVAEASAVSSINSRTSIKMVLDSSLASLLERQFGPVSDASSDSLTDFQRIVVLDLDIAKLIYDKWKETLQFPSATDSHGANSLPYLSYDTSAVQSNCQPSKNEDHLFTAEDSNSFNFMKTPESLTDIMNLEHALEMSIAEKLRNRKKHEDISLILKRRKLHSMFPGVDPLALDSVFDSNNCSLEQTVKTLEADIGKPAKLPPDSIAWQTYRPFQEFHAGDWSSGSHEGGFMTNEELESTTQNTQEAEYWRAEATMHFQMRQEYIQKAQSAYSRSMPDVASFYSRKGDFHASKFKTANKKAAEIIVQTKNQCLESVVLDLHGLYVQEAIPVLRRFMKMHKEKLFATPSVESLTLSIITGRGAHSNQGPKLRPSVMKFLTSTGFRYDEINLGVFNVHLLPSPEA